MNQKVANAVIFCNQDHNSHLQIENFKYTIFSAPRESYHIGCGKCNYVKSIKFP